MSSVTWKDVVDLDEIYLRNACKSPASNTVYLTLRSSHCQSTCRRSHIKPNIFLFCLAKICCDLLRCSIPHSNDDVQINTAISLARIYTKMLCVAHVFKAALELILHDTSFAIVIPAYSQSVINYILHNLCSGLLHLKWNTFFRF